MSPLAAVALAREQGVGTIVHVSCRDRNRLALQSQVVGAAALGSEGVLCIHGDPVEGIPRVRDLKATSLIAAAKQWAEPHQLEVGAVVNPFAPDLDRELALLERKLAAGADFVQSQMIFDLGALRAFLERAAELLAGVRFYAGIALLRNERMAERARRLPGCLLPDRAYRQISMGGGVALATELATEPPALPGSTRCTSIRSARSQRPARSPAPFEVAAAFQRNGAEVARAGSRSARKELSPGSHRGLLWTICTRRGRRGAVARFGVPGRPHPACVSRRARGPHAGAGAAGAPDLSRPACESRARPGIGRPTARRLAGRGGGTPGGRPIRSMEIVRVPDPTAIIG